jgi:hypothetical protein
VIALQRFLVVTGIVRVYASRMFVGGIARLTDAVDASADETFSNDQLRELLALRSRLEAVVTRAVGAFHVTGDCALDGAASTPSRLTWQTSLSGSDAARLIRCGTALRSLPVMSAAVETGRVSIGQVDAIITATGDRLETPEPLRDAGPRTTTPSCDATAQHPSMSRSVDCHSHRWLTRGDSMVISPTATDRPSPTPSVCSTPAAPTSPDRHPDTRPSPDGVGQPRKSVTR